MHTRTHAHTHRETPQPAEVCARRDRQRDTDYWSLRCLIVTGDHRGSGDYEYRSDPALAATGRTRA